jgi:hypothetical protein
MIINELTTRAYRFRLRQTSHQGLRLHIKKEREKTGLRLHLDFHSKLRKINEKRIDSQGEEKQT